MCLYIFVSMAYWNPSSVTVRGAGTVTPPASSLSGYEGNVGLTGSEPVNSGVESSVSTQRHRIGCRAYSLFVSSSRRFRYVAKPKLRLDTADPTGVSSDRRESSC